MFTHIFEAFEEMDHVGLGVVKQLAVLAAIVVLAVNPVGMQLPLVSIQEGRG